MVGRDIRNRAQGLASGDLSVLVGGKRALENPFRGAWSPSGRALLTGLGAGLFLYGLTRSAPAACILGTVGAALAAEGLTNAAKHAEARTVRLSVEAVDLPESSRADTAGIRLTIEDDGAGRRPNGTFPGNGMGLLNMQERVAALGGSISFDDRPGAGLRVRVIVPVGRGEKGANDLARH